jgi:imidazolonepropionase-like amidohydrolase
MARTAIRCGRLLDVAAGSYRQSATIVVQDDRVEAVVDSFDGPAGAPTVDLGALTVLPGLIDTHSHLVGEIQTAGVPRISSPSTATRCATSRCSSGRSS